MQIISVNAKVQSGVDIPQKNATNSTRITRNGKHHRHPIHTTLHKYHTNTPRTLAEVVVSEGLDLSGLLVGEHHVVEHHARHREGGVAEHHAGGVLSLRKLRHARNRKREVEE